MFHGPREAILPFFEGLGFGCPLGKGAADPIEPVVHRNDLVLDNA